VKTSDAAITHRAEAPIDLSTLNLNGEWIGQYRGHFDQVVRITQRGDEIQAVKITGDDHVPGGGTTFRANIRTSLGEGQVAEKEFRNPSFVPGRVTVISPERLCFTWEGCGSVEFRKDD
jgi:uncharacterized protein DUF3506